MRRSEILCLGVFKGCGRNIIFTVNTNMILERMENRFNYPNLSTLRISRRFVLASNSTE